MDIKIKEGSVYPEISVSGSDFFKDIIDSLVAKVEELDEINKGLNKQIYNQFKILQEKSKAIGILDRTMRRYRHEAAAPIRCDHSMLKIQSDEIDRLKAANIQLCEDAVDKHNMICKLKAANQSLSDQCTNKDEKVRVLRIDNRNLKNWLGSEI